MQYTGHPSSIPGWRRTPGGRNGKPLQYSGLEKAMERGDSQATAHWAKKSQKWQWLSTMHTHPTESPCVHLELTQEFKSALNSVTQSCLTLCDPMDWRTPGSLVLHQLLELTQTRPLSWWCHWTISSSVLPFSSHLQSFPASVFSNESVLHIRWPKSWSFSFSISPSNEYSGLI